MLERTRRPSGRRSTSENKTGNNHIFSSPHIISVILEIRTTIHLLHLQRRTAEGSLGISISYSNGQHQVRLHDATLPSGWLDNSSMVL